MPELPSGDPITTHSLAFPLVVSAVLLVLALGWTLYDEVYGLRPWRLYQGRFKQAYSAYLKRQIPRARAQQDALEKSPEYQKLLAEWKAAHDATQQRTREIDQASALIEQQRAAMTEAFQTARGKVGSIVYQLEIHPGDKPPYQKDLAKAKAETYAVLWPVGGGIIQERKLTYDQLNATFNDLLAQKAKLVEERAQVTSNEKDLREKLDAYVKDHREGLGPDALQGLLSAAEGMEVEIRQINVNPPGAQINFLGGAGLVDRCQSCHLGTDVQFVPLDMALTKADLGLPRNHGAPFISHPDPDLLKIHDPGKFGCSPCHGGNGRALDSVRRAHGRYEHWLWPLSYPANYEAGCQQCHSADMVTEHGPVLTLGKELYRLKGCIGCHKFQGFDDEPEQLVNTRQAILRLEQTKQDDANEIRRLQHAADVAPDNETAQRLNQQATNLTVTISGLDAQIGQLEEKSHSLLQAAKKVGPDLKEVRMKIRKEWIPYWLGNTHQFRPTTKMPQFRLEPDEIQAIAAFIWQDSLSSPPLAKQPLGDPKRGKELFDERGCLACHSIGEGSNLLGGTFAANLARMGEKASYDYLVRWVHNPRERTRPYCPYEKRDLGPQDYAKHGLPFVFDLDHSRCPNDGHELVVQQPTAMPSLRLSWQDARDLASYLVTLKLPDASYAPAPFMDDPRLKAKGEDLVKHYGCAGCHEIAGLEDEGRIGTELTNEGSKPIERLDFALFTEDARRGILPDGKKSPRGPWYDSKGFLEQKLMDPGIFDRGKYKPDPMDRLRMPKPNLQSNNEVEALTTMLLGSTDPTLPPDYMYRPSDRRRDIQEGWWVVTKYNCIGCHQIQVGQQSVLMTLPQYQAENKVNLPPVLFSEGARVSPEWLRRFLANPALSATDTNRNGVRSYLQLRMPTFFLSEDEIRKLVRFFGAMSSQPEPFIPPKLVPLTNQERAMARALFTSPAAPCLKCHATGNPVHDKSAIAPNFVLDRDRLQPAWTERWVLDPQKIAPGTAMPSGLFRREGSRWVFNAPVPSAFQKYPGDEADLLVRYIFELTPEEQRLLLRRSPAGAGGGSN